MTDWQAFDDCTSSAYDGLAVFYDEFQAEVDNEVRAAFLDRIIAAGECGPPQGEGGRPLLLDLGCGTGAIFPPLAERGYDLIGIDRSSQMLAAARESAAAADIAVLLLQQDISDFELYGSVNVITCLLDTVNHLLDREQLLAMFRLCKTYLEPGGLLIFDALAEAYFAETLGQQQFFSITDERCLFWQHHYDPVSSLSRADITVLEAVDKRPASGGSGSLYRREDFVVEERFYPRLSLERDLKEAGFTRVKCLAATDSGLEDGNNRIFFIAR